MFIRVKKVQSTKKIHEYLQIVENRWEKGKVRQRVIATLGKMEDLIPSGQIDRFIESLSKFTETLTVINLHREGALLAEWSKIWGPYLIFRRIWEQLGIPEILKGVLRERNFQFDVEKAVFSLVLQRFLSPGSDLLGSKWIRGIYGEGMEEIQLQYFYRSLAFLSEKKDYLEDRLFENQRHILINEVDIVFFDTTTLYFEGKGPLDFARRGFSKDKRPQENQVVVGIVMSREGRPISCFWWPGNTADVEAAQKIAANLKKRFFIRDIILVCDRGMVSAKNLKKFTSLGFKYIVGMKMRRMRHIRNKVIGKRGRYLPIKENLKVKEVFVKDTRYILCYNPLEALRDKEKRESILQDLREKLACGKGKSLIGNRGYRAFLTLDKNAININERKVQEESRFDGKYVIRTDTNLPKEKVALTYKRLSELEALLRDMKDLLEVRPIFHRKEDMVKAHIFVCFLSLRLMVELKKKMEEADIDLPWKEIILLLNQISAVKVKLGEKEFLLRTQFPKGVNEIFRAVGVRPPPLAQLLSPKKEPEAAFENPPLVEQLRLI